MKTIQTKLTGDYHADCNLLLGQIASCEKHLDLTKELIQITNAMVKFTKHSKDCQSSMSPFCQCGLDELIAKLDNLLDAMNDINSPSEE